LNNLISNAIKYKDVSKEESFVTILLNAIMKTQLSLSKIMVSALQKINREGYLRCFIAPPNFHWLSLGMYIVKETLEKLAGTITLKSKENKGTKFIIQFPNQNKN
jgi:signal transduction histidine kinase